MPKLGHPTDIEIETRWKPYIAALGRVTHSWNHLQEALGHVFAAIARLDHSAGFAIWYSTHDDRAQRRILRAIAMKTLDDELERYPTAQDDFLWMLKEADKAGDKRNDAIHAPCTMGIVKHQFEVIPNRFYGHPRAVNLSGKDIVSEFERYEQHADALAGYARAVATRLSSRQGEWPERPRLPKLR